MILDTPPLYEFLDIADACSLALSCRWLWEAIPSLVCVRSVLFKNSRHVSQDVDYTVTIVDESAPWMKYNSLSVLPFALRCARSGGLRNTEFLACDNGGDSGDQRKQADWVEQLLSGILENLTRRRSRLLRLYVAKMLWSHIPYVGHSIRSIVLGPETTFPLIVELLEMAGGLPTLRTISHKSTLPTFTVTAAVQIFARAVAQRAVSSQHREKDPRVPGGLPLRYNANSGSVLDVSDFRCGICYASLFRNVDTFAVIACGDGARRVFLQGTPDGTFLGGTGGGLLCPSGCHAQFATYLIGHRDLDPAQTMGMRYVVNCNPWLVHFDPSEEELL